MRKYLENDFATFRLEKGILHIIYKENVTIFLRDAREVVAQRLVFQQGRAYPILCNIKGVVSIGKDARKYLAMEGSVLIKALALVSNSPLSQILSKVYIKANSTIQVKMFTEEIKALEFLSHLVDRNVALEGRARDI